VRFWLGLNFEPYDQLLDHARMAEELGFEGVLLPDHIAIPSGEITPHPSGYPLLPEEEFPEPLICFAAMASVTTRLRFLTGVLVVPLRDPYLLAKQLGTLARMSGNRVLLGTGTGWLKEEFDLLGAGFADRGARMDEALDLMLDLWDDGWGEPRGQDDPRRRSAMFPAPEVPIPVWVGGHSTPAMRRAARFDGYLPMRPLDEVSRREFAEIDRIRAERGLTGPFARITYWPGGDESTAAEMEERDGITDVITFPWDQYTLAAEVAKAAAGRVDAYVRPSFADKRAAAEALAEKAFSSSAG
jgi:probable F420-dependent oxidoreductase